MSETYFFSLIVCTYQRAESLLRLLRSVEKQTLYPNEILIIDGSLNDATKEVLSRNQFRNLKYFKVDDEDRGLTKQRNFGVKVADPNSDILCFLDDDVILHQDYFKELISTYNSFPNALAVGGYITNEVSWGPSEDQNSGTKFSYDGWERSEPLRFRLRRWFGLQPNQPPGFLPEYSHGRSISFLPPSGKTYKVEQLMGGVASYKRAVFDELSFSKYFEGYGLYEDADFSLRLSKIGDIYINTKAQLEHHHESSGRPNKFRYGKMVVRNGWYVWRVKNPEPTLKAKLKFYLIHVVLMMIRLINVINTADKKGSFNDFLGRLSGLFSLIWSKPQIER